MEVLLSLVLAPLMIMNTIGALVGIIWLAILGQWSTLGAGLAAMFLMPTVYSLANLPQLGFTRLANWFGERDWRGPTLACVFGGTLWTSALIVGWCVLSLILCLRLSIQVNHLPVLLWGYTVATGPLTMMANQSSAINPFAALQLVVAEFYVIGLSVCWLLDTSATAFFVLTLIAFLAYPLVALLYGTVDIYLARRAQT